jgi:general secretion pathway protein I
LKNSEIFRCKLHVLRFLDNDRAFTLLEVMIAVSIIAITLVTLLGSQSRSLSQATEAQFSVVAPMLASLKLAEVERGVVAMENDDGDFGADFPGYSWKMAVQIAAFEDHQDLANLKRPLQRVELTVRWSTTPYSYALTYYGQRSN